MTLPRNLPTVLRRSWKSWAVLILTGNGLKNGYPECCCDQPYAGAAGTVKDKNTKELVNKTLPILKTHQQQLKLFSAVNFNSH